MPVGEPYIPRDITVHLGRPDEAANNVTVSFTKGQPISKLEAVIAVGEGVGGEA